MTLGEFLPSEDFDPELINNLENEAAKQANIDDQFWRVLYAIPILVNTWMLLGFLLFVKEDSIMFNLSEGKEAEALVLIKKVYSSEEDPHEILETLKN
jgi:hypothetical protein